jgi:PD-(D/E)XK endonuclease
MTPSRATKGASSELKVCSYLLDREWAVYRAVSPHAPYDLVISKGNQLLRIEVRSAYYQASGKVSFPNRKLDASKSDHFALVLPDAVIFQPPLPEI